MATFLLLAGACASDGSGSQDATAGERHTGAPPVPSSCNKDDSGGDDSDAGEDASGEADGSEDAVAAITERGAPDVAEVVAEVGDGSAPVDLVEGDGDVVIEDGTATVHYVIINPKDGSQLESSWEIGDPVPIPVAGVFPEFGENISGMKVGGRRAFMVPASQVLGTDPPPESGVAADDNLIFVVDLANTSEDAAPGAGGTVEADDDALKAAEDRGAPEMEVPEGDKDTKELVWTDDVVGDGAVVCPGDTVLAHYTGIQASDGEEFDSSWERGEPSEFGLDQVIKGWTDGLVGMKVGGRRTLVIPADQAYGDDAAASGRPEGVLVFTVDMIGVS
ncbi:MAG: FKBP-type peptidyl-prolyl cis-trans isomerase [Microthrixaceae bacterium]